MITDRVVGPVRRFFALALFAAALSAQNVEYGPFPFDLPPADAGVPYDYTLIPGLDEIIGTAWAWQQKLRAKRSPTKR